MSGRKHPTKSDLLQKPPTKSELVSLLHTLLYAAHSLMTRWDDDIPAHVRAEIMTELYNPMLEAALRAKIQPLPRNLAP